MSNRHSAGTKRYMLVDALASFVAWLLFFIYRKYSIEVENISLQQLIDDANFIVGAFFIMMYWTFFFALSNCYYSIYEKSRLEELIKTVLLSLTGNILLFFLLLLNDRISFYQDYYRLFAGLFGFHVLLVLAGRMVILFRAKSEMRSQRISFPTLIIGNHPQLNVIYKELVHTNGEHGLKIMGQYLENENEKPLEGVTSLGQMKDLRQTLQPSLYDYAILALSPQNQQELSAWIEFLDENGVRIKLIPDLKDILSGQLKLSNVIGTLLLDVQTYVMAPWERVLKRGFDIGVAIFSLTVLSPFMIYLAIKVKKSSPGPIFFSQERIGYGGKPYMMYKFRSMYQNAEDAGPQLSHETDDRITPFGKIIRKYRFDELPQFYHVLKGEMSLVGPRPERAFFAQQLIAQAPHYKYIYKVKPGITSWGMVKYGYASDVKSMLERMQYDLLYVENFSFLLDIRILIHTVLIILKGRGV